MSFWTDADNDDDQGFTPSFVLSSFAEAEIKDERCPHCGSADFYVDEFTGVTHCTECFTQSQTLSQVDVVGEEDVDAIAARTGGRIMSRRAGGRMRLGPDSGLDSSRPLPELTVCLGGMQIVLKMAAERAAVLAGLDEARGKKAMAETTKAIWFGYLLAWRAGAKRYKAKFPQLRFSLRDSFIGEHRRRMILRHLSAACSNSVSIGGDNTPQHPGNCRVKEEDASNELPAPTTSAMARTKILYASQGSSYGNVVAMLSSLTSETMDEEQAALRLQPSMALVGSIILLSLVRLRAGVTSNHIAAWAANGSLPYLLNSFIHLPRETRNELESIRAFFVKDTVPPAGVFDYQLNLLAIACNMRLERPAPKVARVSVRKRKRDTEEDEGILNDDLGGIDGAETRSDGEPWSDGTDDDGAEKEKRRSVCNIPYVDNVPLQAARLVADFGFGQRVLDIALALMGFVPLDEEQQSARQPWLPPSLEGTSVENLASPLHIMAVIVVATKMCKGWEEYMLSVPIPKQHERTKICSQKHESGEDEGGESDSSSIVDSLRTSFTVDKEDEEQQSKGVKQRFVPCTEEQLRLVGNGPMLNDYFDFIDESITSEMSVSEPFGDLVLKLQKKLHKNKNGAESNTLLGNDPVVKPNVILAGAPNPNSPRADENPDETIDSDRSTCSDANAFGKYVIYNSSLVEPCEESKLSKPFHPHYGLLIEYMAFKASADPSDLHRLVENLDKEIMAISRR